MLPTNTRPRRSFALLFLTLPVWAACTASSGGGKSNGTDVGAAGDASTATDVPTSGGGLGCACANDAACAAGFCSDFQVCTTNDAVECQADGDCGCDARCIAIGEKKTCQIPCTTTADCPGKLGCDTLDVPWTTTSGDTITLGCVATVTPAGVTWIADIQLIVGASCVGCHTGGGLSGGVNFDSYANTQGEVTNCPEGQTRKVAAVMAEKVSAAPPCGSRMPLGGAPLSDAQVQLFVDWVAAGAPEQ